MQNQQFERLLDGQPIDLTQQQLMEFCGFCSARSFPLTKLIEFSVTLFDINREYCHQFLNYIDKNQIGKTIYNDYQHQGYKITIYSHLTALVLARATRQDDKGEYERLMGEAKKYLNSSEKVRMTVDKSIILNRAFLHYYTGQTTKALNLVTRIYEEIQKTQEGGQLLVAVMLMLAQIYFLRRSYAKSLDFYKKCLSLGRGMPARGRIGMAYCFFNLGKYEMARACFQRVLKLQPSSVEALVGIAIIYDKEQNHAKYFQYITSAYRMDRRHPLVLLHLGQHFLLRKQLNKSAKFAELGLQALGRTAKFHSLEEQCRNDVQDMRARFNNILGQVHHINGNFAEAIRCYVLGVGRKLVFNQISLAQCYINPTTQNYGEAIRLLEESYKGTGQQEQKMLMDSYKLMGYLKSKVPSRGLDDKSAEYYYAEAIKFSRHDFDSKIEYANLLVDTNKLKALKLLEEAEKIQETQGNEIRPELLNNIAVLYLQNQESDVCQDKLKRCLQDLQAMVVPSGGEEELRVSSLLLIARFNYGICMQRRGRWYSAKEAYEQILSTNKYHIDSALRLAYVWLKLGNYRKMQEMLEQIDKDSQAYRRVLRTDRYITPKAYLLHMGGNSSEAKQTLKTLGKSKDIYSTLLQLCINYQNIMRKGVELNILKEFLRPNRQFCYKFCKEDPHATFGYMLLAIICLVDKKFTKAQGLEFFNSLKQFSADDLPTILFNMGFFLLNYDDYDNAILVLGMYKDRVGSSRKVDQLISLAYLLDNQIQKASQFVRRNIIREPCNLKYKVQYSYLLERQAQQYYEKGEFAKREVEKRLKQLRYCTNTYNFLAKVSVSEYIRHLECPELRERVKNIYTKVKSCAQQRRLYIKSYFEWFEKVLKDLAEEQIKREKQKKEAAFALLQEQNQRGLMKLLDEQEESEDQEEKERRQLDRKRQRVLEIARKKQEEINSAWQNLKAIDKENDDDKKNRKRGPRQASVGGVTAGRKRQKRQKQSEAEYDVEPEPLPQEQQSYQQEASVQERQPNLDSDTKRRQKEKKEKKDKRHKKHKKHKHKKHRQNSGGEQVAEDGDVGSEHSQVRDKGDQKKEQDDNNDEQEIMKYRI